MCSGYAGTFKRKICSWSSKISALGGLFFLGGKNGLSFEMKNFKRLQGISAWRGIISWFFKV